MPARLEVLFSPAEFMALNRRDLSKTVCVVFDVLRATSTMMTALANGAQEIVPVAEISEALAIRKRRPEVLLAGERDGWRIRGERPGEADFDLGNSPREFTRDVVGGRCIVMTTTNGTRALRGCAGAQAVLIGTFHGISALAEWIQRRQPEDLLLVCAGTFEQSSYEDILGAGALCDQIWPAWQNAEISDSARISKQVYRQAAGDLMRAMQDARNARRLLSRAELRDDVAWCLQPDIHRFVAQMADDGIIRAQTA